MTTDILILGDGPLAYALAIAIQKVAPELALRIAAPPTMASNSASANDVVVLDHHSKAILESLDAWPSVAKKAQQIRLLHISEQGRLGVTRFTARDLRSSAAISKDVLAHAVVPADLCELLAQRCERALVTGFQTAELGRIGLLEGGEVQAELNGEVVTAALVLPSDQASAEYLITELGLASTGSESDAVLLSAELQFEQSAAEQVFVRFTSSGPMTFIQTPESEQVTLHWAVSAAVAAELLALDEASFAERIQEDFGWRLGRLISASNRQSDSQHWRCENAGSVIGLGEAHYRDPSSQWPWPTGLNRGLQDVGHFADALAAVVQAGGSVAASSSWRDFINNQAEQLQRTVDSEAAVKRWFTSDLGPLNHLRGVALMGLGASASLKRMLLSDYGQQTNASQLERRVS